MAPAGSENVTGRITAANNVTGRVVIALNVTGRVSDTRRAPP